MKFTVYEWAEENGNFRVRFSVASNKLDKLEQYEIFFRFSGEDPQLFMNKLRNYMVSHVSYRDNLKAAKNVLSGYTFSDPTVHYYEIIGESDVTQ